jgi:uncharacterized protein
MFALAVALSVLGLALGPLLVAFGQRRTAAGGAMAWLTLGAVLVLVVTRFLPDLWVELGLATPVLIVAGYAGFGWLEARGGHDVRDGSALVLPAFAVHSAFDGSLLAAAFGTHASGDTSAALGLALVAHRLPEGLFFGATFVPRVGVAGALKRVAVLALATVAGAIGGREVLDRVPDVLSHGLVALAVGVMLRLVVHRHR